MTSPDSGHVHSFAPAQDAAPDAGRPADGQPAPSRRMFLEEELFRRDLSEVHMLIDFVSGRADKSLAGLHGIGCYGSKGKIYAASPQQVIQEICKISYPPTGNIAANAQQAAFMLVVKDRLNYLASPARGLTIAFTSMFAGVSLRFYDLVSISADRLFAVCVWLLNGAPRGGPVGRGPDAGAELAEEANPPDPERQTRDSRRRLYAAREAYPNLEAQARKFRAFYKRLPMVAILVVWAVVYTNFDISLTSSALQHISTAQYEYSKLLETAKGDPPSVANCARAGAPPSGCAEARIAIDRIVAGRAELGDLMGGWRWLHPAPLAVWLLAHTVDQPRAVAAPPDDGQYLETTPLEAITGDAVTGLSTILIPTLFGWLGTMAGLMRSITLKVRESVLSPRDLMISRIGICLGMSAGLAVGLFFKQLGSTPTIGPLGVSVSTAGLSFLAGFGAEAFFSFLDGLLLRTFTAVPAPGPPTIPPP